MSAPVDQATRELVSRDGLGRTLFVEAGAGTGKTTQLVDRIANLVLVEGVRLRNIAAITFTEAAAAELQARIRVKFEERAAHTADEVERERAEAAIADVDMAALSTLHGFASRLLSEFAIAAGLPPRVHVLDEVSSQLAHEQRWERFIDALYDDPAHEEELVRAALVNVAFEPRYQGHATLKDVAAELNDNWDRLVLLDEDPGPLRPPDFSKFDAAVAAVCELPDDCADCTDLFYVHLTENLIPHMTRLVSISDPNRKLANIASVGGFGVGRGGRAAAWNGDAKAAKARVHAVNDAIEQLVADVADDVLRRLLVLISQHVLESARARREEGGLEFHDLLVLARELLRTSPDARARLHDRYTHILLDEFQDTDPIQIELAILIAASVQGDPPESWHELAVDEGRLFFVGDPKQSIYRFRRADIGLFLEARDRFGPEGSWQRLTTNFRTVEAVLEWVNAFFGDSMAEEHAGQQPRYEPLSAWRDPHPTADHRPVLLGGPHPDPKVRAGELRETEAADVARVVADVRDHPDRWPVFDHRDDAWRPARLSDVTILLPTRTSLSYLRDALDGAGLPYRLATGTLVYDTQEVRDALAAVRAIDDPTDRLSVVAALRSPLYACSDVDLFTFRNAGGRWDPRREPPESVPADHPVRLAFEHLRSLWEQRWWLSPAALLDRLLRERRAFLLALGDRRPAEVWRRLRFLVDQARAFEEANGGGLRAFVEWAALQGADSARVHEPLLPETDDDAVRILTIHGAKGLEFPITILSGMTTKPGNPRRGVSLVWGDDGRPEVSLRKGVATANHEPRFDLEIEMDAHEKLRLLYVAATRARDHLVVSAHHKVEGNGPDGKETYASRVWRFFQDRPELWRTLPEEPLQLQLVTTEPRVVPTIDDDRAAWVAAREALLEPQRIPRAMSATAVARAVRDDLHDDDDDAADDSDDDAAVPHRRRGRAGTAVGRAVHATLQLVDLADPQHLDGQVRRQCEIESIPESVEHVTRMVRSALESDAVQLAITRPHHKELYVAAPVGQRLIEGYVDLLIETPEGLVIVDYKTDGVRSDAELDEKLAGYELQGAAYALALQEVTGRPVVDCRFVFCRPSGAIERSVPNLRDAVERARAVVVHGRAGSAEGAADETAMT
jgi:ATP-dependent exoDNAse (exonuclease V) beta subunit